MPSPSRSHTDTLTKREFASTLVRFGQAVTRGDSGQAIAERSALVLAHSALLADLQRLEEALRQSESENAQLRAALGIRPADV